MKKHFLLLLALTIGFHSFTVAQTKKTAKATRATVAKNDTVAVAAKHHITFVELGSVNCIPCRAMQPIMKSVEAKYGGRVKVVFYDVWKQEQAHYAQQYGIRVIPTQVFLDKEGKEVFRHEGFFPEVEIDALLAKHGLKANL